MVRDWPHDKVKSSPPAHAEPVGEEGGRLEDEVLLRLPIQEVGFNFREEALVFGFGFVLVVLGDFQFSGRAVQVRSAPDRRSREQP